MSHCHNSLTQFFSFFPPPVLPSLWSFGFSCPRWCFILRLHNPIGSTSWQDKVNRNVPDESDFRYTWSAMSNVAQETETSSVWGINWSTGLHYVYVGDCWGSWTLTPCGLPFVRLALRADRLLLRGLVLAVLPPLFQLEVNEFPHHPSLCQADGCQTSHPEGRRGLI